MKCNSCRWIKTSRGEKCEVCKDVFPCKENCGHLDCHFQKARKCHKCGKRISNKNLSYYFVDGKGARCYFVHKECVGEDYIFKVIVG